MTAFTNQGVVEGPLLFLSTVLSYECFGTVAGTFHINEVTCYNNTDTNMHQPAKKVEKSQKYASVCTKIQKTLFWPFKYKCGLIVTVQST